MITHPWKLLCIEAALARSSISVNHKESVEGRWYSYSVGEDNGYAMERVSFCFSMNLPHLIAHNHHLRGTKVICKFVFDFFKATLTLGVLLQGKGGKAGSKWAYWKNFSGLKEFLDNTVTVSAQMHITSFWKRTGSCRASVSAAENRGWLFLMGKKSEWESYQQPVHFITEIDWFEGVWHWVMYLKRVFKDNVINKSAEYLHAKFIYEL